METDNEHILLILQKLAKDSNDTMTWYALFKFFEVLFTLSHQNTKILSSLGIIVVQTQGRQGACLKLWFMRKSSTMLVLQSNAKALPQEGISFSVCCSVLNFFIYHFFIVNFRCGFSCQVFPSYPFQGLNSRCITTTIPILVHSNGKLSIISNAVQDDEATFSTSKVGNG